MRVCDGAFRSTTVAGFVVCLVAFAFAFASASPASVAVYRRRLAARQELECNGPLDCEDGLTCTNFGTCEMLGPPGGNDDGREGDFDGPQGGGQEGDFGGPKEGGQEGDFGGPKEGGQEGDFGGPKEGGREGDFDGPQGGGREGDFDGPQGGEREDEWNDEVSPHDESPPSQDESTSTSSSSQDESDSQPQISRVKTPDEDDSGGGTVGSENAAANSKDDGDEEQSKDFMATTAGKAVMGTVFCLLLIAMIVLSVIICRNRRNKRRIGSAKGFRSIPSDEVSGGPERRPSPPPMLTLDTKIVNPEPFLEPHMITPLEGHDTTFFPDSPTVANNMTSVVSHGPLNRTLSRNLSRTQPRANLPKRSSTIYGNQGSSTANVELSAADVTTQYPMVQQHHFMSSEYENNES